ncbi:MAG TPA: SDR family oxidoreductase [Gammaproteobacteria bacterium]|nr:SDR family oxidoreductase [Gammaproteobacteria bacterium]
MDYFVTGATGFIGRRLVQRLLARDGKIFVLVRGESAEKLAALRAYWGDEAEQRIVPIQGDLTQPQLGLAADDLATLRGQIGHFFHLAAIYNINASAESQQRANVDGTREALACAEALEAGCFHHISSIAAAGLYPGVFSEDMFEQAEHLGHPYFSTKHEGERLVRQQYPRPWRIYRPAFVVGDSRTGEMDKIDGPYYLFKPIQRLRDALPQWFPVLGLEGGYVNMVPVDYVVQALDHLSHLPDLDGQTFQLVDPAPHRFSEVIRIFCHAAHAPEPVGTINARLFTLLPSFARAMLSELEPARQIGTDILQALGLPAEVFRFINWPTRYDNRRTWGLLAEAGIELPPLDSYAWRLWDYWERHLDPDLFREQRLRDAVAGKVVVITGGSSGIGRATAFRLAQAGARLALVSRDETELQETSAALTAQGGSVAFYVTDLTDMDACGAVIEQILRDHGQIDVLINNAGRSIRRAIEHAYDRLHDYQRTMQLNYFACVKLTLAVLPSMVERDSGQIINISSIGVLSNAPRFSAYVASKAALEAFSRCAGAEFAHTGIDFTIINFPLVRTPMIAPTESYRNAHTLSPEQAAEMVVEALIKRPERVATGLGKLSQLIHAFTPQVGQRIMNAGFREFPESAAALGGKAATTAPSSSPPSAGQMALARLLRGVHW